MKFSERMGIIPQKGLQINSIDSVLRNRMFNEFFSYIGFDEGAALYALDRIGQITFDNEIQNRDALKKAFLSETPWCIPYDIYEFGIEGIIKYSGEELSSLQEHFECLNEILKQEQSAYRMVDGKFIRISNETELIEIKNALHSTFDSVDTHIQKALALYSDRKQPDYENSIKESISAVEAMCCIITGLTGGQATLGAALKKLEDNGVEIHGAMRSAFSQLYGYTSDQNGIRHGGIDFTNAPEEDARYMLVTCSAFVNYLKDKYAKAQSGGTT